MNNAPPVSQHQLAQRLGISQATVSMALAGNPRISPSMRERVLAAARELGYVPDPALRALGRYRRAVGQPAFRAVLAWVHNWHVPDWWVNSAVWRAAYDGASAAAERFGYKLENFWIDEPNRSPERASRILAARGISGILLLPSFGRYPRIELNWKDFTTVRFCDYHQGDSSMHLVAADHYSAMRDVLGRTKALGYKRPGLVTSRFIDHITLNQYRSAFLSETYADARGTGHRIFEADPFSADSFVGWIREEKIDVLVMAYISEIIEASFDVLREAGLRVPEDIGVVMPCRPDVSHESTALPNISGIEERFGEMGERGVELLVSLCEGFEKGLPVAAIRHLLAGTWHDGETLRPQNSPATGQKKARPRA